MEAKIGSVVRAIITGGLVASVVSAVSGDLTGLLDGSVTAHQVEIAALTAAVAWLRDHVSVDDGGIHIDK